MTLPDNPGKKPDAAVAVKVLVDEAAKEVENEEEDIEEQDKNWDDLFGIQAGVATDIKKGAAVGDGAGAVYTLHSLSSGGASLCHLWCVCFRLWR